MQAWHSCSIYYWLGTYLFSARNLQKYSIIQNTLSFYNNEPSKNKHFLILLSSLARNSQEPKLKTIFEIPWVLFEKSLSLYFDWPKSWIWRTLEKVMNIFCKWHFYYASKEVFWQKIVLNFMHGFKSAILAECKNCQNATFEPVHEIQKKFWPKAFFWSIMKMGIRKNIHNLSQGPPNQKFFLVLGSYESPEGLEC